MSTLPIWALRPPEHLPLIRRRTGAAPRVAVQAARPRPRHRARVRRRAHRRVGPRRALGGHHLRRPLRQRPVRAAIHAALLSGSPSGGDAEPRALRVNAPRALRVIYRACSKLPGRTRATTITSQSAPPMPARARATNEWRPTARGERQPPVARPSTIYFNSALGHPVL